jgi:hypothetical protein
VSVATTTTTTEWGDIGPYVSQALEYATDVVEGRVPACKWMRLACERQLADLERDGPEFPFYFDVEAASRPCGPR